MSFTQYSQSQFRLQVNSSFNTEISMIIPVTADTFLMLKANKTYEYIGIRKNIVINKGKLPENFTPSFHLEPLILLEQSIIYLVDDCGVICRFDVSRNQMKLRRSIQGQLLDKKQKNIISYYYLEPTAKYLIVSAFNRDTFNTSLFIYDWQNNKYSNLVTLNKNFNKYKIIYYNTTTENQQQFNDIKFAILSTGSAFNKIHVADLEFLKNQAKFNILSHKQLSIGFSFVPLGGTYKNQYIYLLGNSYGQGIFILRYNVEDNSSVKCSVNLQEQTKNSGIARTFLGAHNGNVTIFFQQTPNSIHHKNRKLIYNIPLNHKLFEKNIDVGIDGTIVANKQKSLQEEEDGQFKDFSNIKPSIDGFSFHRYWLPCQSIMKKFRKEGAVVEAFLFAQVILKIPKKFFYLQIGEHLGLSQNFISEILNLL